MQEWRENVAGKSECSHDLRCPGVSCLQNIYFPQKTLESTASASVSSM